MEPKKHDWKIEGTSATCTRCGYSQYSAFPDTFECPGTSDRPALDGIEDNLLKYINDTPDLLSMLYDADLMPEQLERGSKAWVQMLIISAHWKAKEMEKT